MKCKYECPRDYRRNYKEEILGFIDATIVTFGLIGFFGWLFLL